MPRYDYHCKRCHIVAEQCHRMDEKPDPCSGCGSRALEKLITKAPGIKMAPDSGWEMENGGRGRYISQLQQEPGEREPAAYCRSQSEAMDKAKRRGLKVTRVR